MNVKIINNREDDYISTLDFIDIKYYTKSYILLHFVHMKFIKRRIK